MQDYFIIGKIFGYLDCFYDQQIVKLLALQNRIPKEFEFCLTNSYWHRLLTHIRQYIRLFYAKEYFPDKKFRKLEVLQHLSQFYLLPTEILPDNLNNKKPGMIQLQLVCPSGFSIQLYQFWYEMGERLASLEEKEDYLRKKKQNSEMHLKWEDEWIENDSSLWQQSNWKKNAQQKHNHLQFIYENLVDPTIKMDQNDNLIEDSLQFADDVEQKESIEEDEDSEDSQEETHSNGRDTSSEQKILKEKSEYVVLLNQGGYFAACTFDDKGKPQLHKTFHKYVTRKKQGGRQATKDKTKSIRTSVGSQMRRINEDHFREEVEEFLRDERWNSILRNCKLILLHAPGPINKSMMFKELGATYGLSTFEYNKNEQDEHVFFLSQADPRLFKIPVAVQEPINFTQSKQCFETLQTLLLSKQ